MAGSALGRLGGALALAALSPLVLASGANRLAMIGVDVGWPRGLSVGPGAALVETREAIVRGDATAAARAARAALAADPLHPYASGALTLALAQGGDAQAAQDAATVAAPNGWRDPVIQKLVARGALATDDVKVAAERADAMARLRPAEAPLPEELALIERAPGGGAALAGRLAVNPSWAAPYLRSVATLPGAEAAARLAVLTQARNEGMIADCAVIGETAEALVGGDRTPEALALWGGLGCGDVREGNLSAAAGGFEEPRDARAFVTRLRWHLATDGRVNAVIEPGQAGGSVARVESSAAITVVALERVIARPAGRYALRWRAIGPDGAAPRDHAVVVECLDGRRLSGSAARAPGGYAAPVAIAGCAAQRVRVTVAPGGSGALVLDDIRLEAAGA